jgi:hypothetical protein
MNKLHQTVSLNLNCFFHFITQHFKYEYKGEKDEIRDGINKGGGETG